MKTAVRGEREPGSDSHCARAGVEVTTEVRGTVAVHNRRTDANGGCWRREQY